MFATNPKSTNQPINQSTCTRIYGLDILRAFAIAYVMHWHGQHFIDPHIPYTSYKWLVLDGVDLFFVLSGFLIGGILLRDFMEDNLSMGTLWQFWIRRWFRTLPNYFLVLTLLLVSYQLFRDGLPQRWYQYYFFVQNLNSPHPVFFSEAWSLSVEEWFYLLVPVGLFIILKRTTANRQKATLSWIVFVIVAVTLYRIYKVAHLQPGANYSLEIRRQVFTRLDSIMYGVLGAYVSFYYHHYWQRYATQFFIAGLATIFSTRILSDFHMGFAMYAQASFMAMGILLLLPKLSSIISRKGIISRFITIVSIASYSMYLINHRTGLAVSALFRKAGIDVQHSFIGSIAAYMAFWVVTIICSYALYRFFERPMTRLRERFSKRGSTEGLQNISSNFQP